MSSHISRITKKYSTEAPAERSTCEVSSFFGINFWCQYRRIDVQEGRRQSWLRPYFLTLYFSPFDFGPVT